MQSILPEARKNMRDMIAGMLEDIGDLARTRLEWDAKAPGVMRSYTEDVSMFFDDFLCQRDLRWNVERGLLTQQEAEGLREFYATFRDFVDRHRDIDEYSVDITKMPDWKDVSLKARKAFELLAKQLRS